MKILLVTAIQNSNTQDPSDIYLKEGIDILDSVSEVQILRFNHPPFQLQEEITPGVEILSEREKRITLAMDYSFPEPESQVYVQTQALLPILSDDLQEYNPDFIFCFGAEAWLAVRHCKNVVVVLPELMRSKVMTRMLSSLENLILVFELEILKNSLVTLLWNRENFNTINIFYGEVNSRCHPFPMGKVEMEKLLHSIN